MGFDLLPLQLIFLIIFFNPYQAAISINVLETLNFIYVEFCLIVSTSLGFYRSFYSFVHNKIITLLNESIKLYELYFIINKISGM